ncbi:hypothetical protein ACFXKY_14860 [Streptomyces canus]|uniref:hypothetical protein n=1 Tax=Streptomyces canus TaxID=58343 RepID=UPI0036D098B5
MTVRRGSGLIYVEITMDADGFYFVPAHSDKPKRIYLQLLVGTVHQDDLEEELRKAGAEPLPQDVHRSAHSVPEYVVVAVTAGPGIWLALRTAIRGLAERHRHKGFAIELPGGGTFSADGHSAKEVALLLTAAERLFEHQNQTPDHHFAAVDRVARQLLAHRADLVVPDEPWASIVSVISPLDAVAALLDDCQTVRQRHDLVGFLTQVVEGYRLLEEMTGDQVATTVEADRALTAVAEVIRDLPHGIFGNEP